MLSVSMATVLLSVAPPASAESKIGDVENARGDVTVLRQGAEKPVGVAEGGIDIGDLLETGFGASARLVLLDGAFVNLGERSAIRITQYSFSPTTNRRTLWLKVVRGTVRSVFFRMKSADSVAVIETSQARISPSMLSDVVIAARSDETDVTVLDGSARAVNLKSYVVGNLVVKANERATVQANAAPASAGFLSPDERRNLIRNLKGY